MKNQLLDTLPELQWAGINSAGSKAIISVQEKTEPEEQKYDTHHCSNIVSATDGIIRTISSTNGSVICNEGQAVTKGQLLISGLIDCGLYIRACRAEGEIFAQTKHEIHAISPLDSSAKATDHHTKHAVSLLVGKKRINLWKDSGIWEASCDRIYQERYLSVPGGRNLPLAICLDTFREYAPAHQLRSTKESIHLLQELSADYLSIKMIAGTILNHTETYDISSGAIKMNGEYHCLEMIGREQFQRIGDQNGKNN